MNTSISIHPGAQLIIDQAVAKAISRVPIGTKESEAKALMAEVLDKLTEDLVEAGYPQSEWTWNVTTLEGARQAREELIAEGWIDPGEVEVASNYRPMHYIVIAIGFDANEQFPERFYSHIVPVMGIDPDDVA